MSGRFSCSGRRLCRRMGHKAGGSLVAQVKAWASISAPPCALAYPITIILPDTFYILILDPDYPWRRLSKDLINGLASWKTDASKESADIIDEYDKGGGGDDSGYKTIVEGTGAGYGELKEYMDEPAADTIEKHAVGEHSEEKHEVGSASFSSDSSGAAVEGKHHHDKEGKHHTGAISKIKHKVKEGLAKVRRKKNHHGEAHSGTSSEDETGLHAEKGQHT
ncbi:hypothetical protein GOP47_0007062 [Adiantum capillus-veneris]|uniref:Uncharacterized protein n=1 Tax=Adiantum capillus-veneris TaxID=13818 RepID=A0A9D4V0V4_ADICA|nr:hypothetical protein GOP47_0007062 [Adiantum capillus-veneris]